MPMTESRSNLTTDARAVEKMLDMGLSLRNQLAEIAPTERPDFWLSLVLKIETELAGKADTLRLVREHLRLRGDANGRALAAYADALLDHYCKADAASAATLGQATPGLLH